LRKRRTARFFGDGVLVVDKPAGPTSHDVVERVRRRFAPAKLGHAGTLDPFATGVLVLAINQMTRLAELLGVGDKVYQGWLQLGRSTDTGDCAGQTVAEAPVPPLDPDQTAAAVEALEGPQMQAPPAFSAAKHQGRPLYAYAREGRQVDKPPKPITVHEARLLSLEEQRLQFRVRCSRGTYVRSLGEDLARALGTVGHLTSLQRLASSPFVLEEAVGLEEVLDWTPQELARAMAAPEQALARCGLGAVTLDEDRVWQIRQGCFLPRAMLLPAGQEAVAGQAFMVLAPKGELAAVLRWLAPEDRRPGRDYETIRVFPERPVEGEGSEASASALGAE